MYVPYYYNNDYYMDMIIIVASYMIYIMIIIAIFRKFYHKNYAAIANTLVYYSLSLE